MYSTADLCWCLCYSQTAQPLEVLEVTIRLANVRMRSLKEFCLGKLWNVCDINARQQVMDYLTMFYEVRQKLKLQLWMRWYGWAWILSSLRGSPVAGQWCSFHLCAIAKNQNHRLQSWQASWCMFNLQNLESFQSTRVHISLCCHCGCLNGGEVPDSSVM